MDIDSILALTVWTSLTLYFAQNKYLSYLPDVFIAIGSYSTHISRVQGEHIFKVQTHISTHTM